jgi:lipopolysaccharide exporter
VSTNLKQLFGKTGQILKSGQTLSQRTVRGGAWMLGLRIIERLLGLVRTVVLARILSPGDFGVIGVALLAMSALETFSQTGFEVALIQRKENIRAYLDTAWTVQLIRGLLLFSVLLVIAPLVALFFNNPESTMIIRAVAVVQLFKGLTNIGVVYFQRDLEFNKQFAYHFSGTFANLVVAVIAALLWRNVWALALGLVTGQIVGCALSFLTHPYRPKLYIDWQKACEIFRFGKWVLATNIVVFLAVNGDDALLGRMLGTTALGLYQVAFRFANLATTEVTRVVSQVTLPAYSKLQDNLERLRSAFLKTLEFTVFTATPVAVGVLFLGPDFARIFLGEKWTPMVIGLQILAVSGLIRSIVATGGPLFNAVARPHLNFWMNLVRVSMMAVMVFPLTKHWGLAGTSVAVLIGISADIPIWLYNSLRITKGNLSSLLGQLFYVLLVSLAMGLPIFVLRQLLSHVGILEFAALCIASTASYLGLSLLLWKRFHRGPVRMIQEIILSM